MRITTFLLAWSLCSIAAAQTLEQRPPAEPAELVDAASARADSPAAAATLTAGTLYLCTYEKDSPLYTVNPSNGKTTRIGSTGIDHLAFRKTAAAGIQLFGTSFTNLFIINPATGKATFLKYAYGAGIGDINALVAQPGSGVLYGAGSTAPGEFVEISPTTGKATKKGTLGEGIGSSGDLEFLNGQLYGLVQKSTTGSKTYLAKISLSGSTVGKATDLLLIQQKVDGKLVALDNVWGLTNRNGVLYIATESGDVLTLVPGTGIASLKGDNHLAQAGLAVAP
jgi:hypothetical protein